MSRKNIEPVGKKHNISKLVIGKCLNTDLKVLTIMSSFQKLIREAEDSENLKPGLSTGGHKRQQIDSRRGTTVLRAAFTHIFSSGIQATK